MVNPGKDQKITGMSSSLGTFLHPILAIFKQPERSELLDCSHSGDGMIDENPIGNYSRLCTQMLEKIYP